MARGLCSGAMVPVPVPVPVHMAEAEAGPLDLVGNLALVGAWGGYCCL